METLLQYSIEGNKKLEIIYISSNGQMSQRIIRAIDNHTEHIIAYCYKRREVRTFKKKNILSVYPLRQHRKNIGA